MESKSLASSGKLAGYKVQRRLTTGGTWDVFLATSDGGDGFERVSVVKMLRPRYAHDAAFDRQFLREAAMYGRLQIPSVVLLHDAIVQGGQLVLAEEFVDGMPLHKLRASLKSRSLELEERAIFHVAAQMFDAVGAAHGLPDEGGDAAVPMHGDLNPSRIFVGWDGRVKVADFGVARLIGVPPDLRVACQQGAFGYLAPEQANGTATLLGSDTYSAALIFWELLSRRRAVTRAKTSDADIMAALASPHLPSLDVLRPTLPKEVRDVIRAALEPDPVKRSVAPQDFVAILRRLVSEQEGAELVASTIEVIRPAPGPEALEVPVRRRKSPGTMKAVPSGGAIPDYAEGAFAEDGLEGGATEVMDSPVATGARALGTSIPPASSPTGTGERPIPSGTSPYSSFLGRSSQTPASRRSGASPAIEPVALAASTGEARASGPPRPRSSPPSSASGGSLPPGARPSGPSLPPGSNPSGAPLPPSSGRSPGSWPMAADGPSVSAFSEPPLPVTSLLPSDAPVEILGVESSIPPSSSRPTRPVAAAGPEWSVYPLAMAPGDLAPPPLPGFPDADKGIDPQGLPRPSALEPPAAPSDFGISDGASELELGRGSEPAPAASVASALASASSAYESPGSAGNGEDEDLDTPNRAAGKKRNPWVFVVAAALTLGVGAAVFTSALSSSSGDKPGAASEATAAAMTKSASAATAETPNSGTKAGGEPGVAPASSALVQVPAEPTNREAPATIPAAPTPAEPPATEPAKGIGELAQKPLEAPPPAPEPPKAKAPEPSPPPPAPESPKPKGPEPATATPPPTPAPGAGSGTLNINAPGAKGHRVFVDGKVVINGQGAVNVPCGVRSVKIGSAGKPQDVTVPCGGSVNLD